MILTKQWESLNQAEQNTSTGKIFSRLGIILLTSKSLPYQTVFGMSGTPAGQDDTNPMTFTENQHGNIILDKLKAQRDAGKFCDVILYVENKKFFLHRNVLSSFSPYFESIFQSRKTTKEKFNITGESAEIFQCFINYMYTGTVIIHKSNVSEMFKLAHRLEVAKLKLYCAEYLERYLDLSNCLAVRHMADKYNMPLLSKLANGFIQNHLEEVLSSQEILELDVSRLKSFLSDKNLGLTQIQIMQVIINWTKQDVFKREKQIKSVLKLIKWMEIDIQHINDIIENENLFVTSEMSLYLMLTHLNENGLTFAKYHSVLDSLNQKYSNMQNEKEEEDLGTISKVEISKKKFKKKQRSLRANPIARLAALRSALVLRRRKSNPDKYFSERDLKLAGEVDDDSLKCHLCDHHSNDTTSLEHHLSSVHSRDVTYKCGVCGFVCQWNNLYLQHIKGHFPGPPYKCDSCEFTSEKLNTVLTHRSVHIQEKIHRCPHCSFCSKSQANVLVHSKIHLSQYQGEKGGQLTDRAYVCDLCGFSSKYLSHLIAHKRIHSSDVYRCSYPHCKYTAAKKSQLVSHAKSHQGVRPHCCNVCGRGFLEKSHLVRHERIHLEEKPFKCHECDYASSRRDKLKEHQARHHGDNASAKVPYKARPNKKPNQLFQENFDSSSRMHQTANEIPDVLVQNHNIPTPNINSYAFAGNDTHIHHSTSSSVSTGLDFHHTQLLNTSNARAKDHSASGSSHRSSHQSSAAAVAAAMMLDPRFHHGNTATGSYTTPPSSMATMVNQAAGQMVQSGHQVSEYPTALMSLF